MIINEKIWYIVSEDLKLIVCGTRNNRCLLPISEISKAHACSFKTKGAAEHASLTQVFDAYNKGAMEWFEAHENKHFSSEAQRRAYYQYQAYTDNFARFKVIEATSQIELQESIY